MLVSAARAFEAWLSQLTLDRPVLLVLEDLHYCDAASLSLIDGALKNMPGLFVLGLGRPETLERLPKLFATRARMLLNLTGLEPSAAGALVRRCSGSVAPGGCRYRGARGRQRVLPGG